MNIHVWELIGVIVALLILRGMFRLVKTIFKQAEKDLIFVLVWRMVTGAHWHGKKRTDAGWFTHGSKSSRHEFEQRGFVHKWEHKPRAHRALWRWGCFFAFLGVIYGLIADTMVTLDALGALVVYGLAVLCFVVEKKVRLRLHNRHVLTPIAKSLAVILRRSPDAVSRMLHIDPENITDEGEIGYLELTDDLTPSEDMQTSIARVIGAHLPVDSEVEWRMLQSPKLGVILAAQKPPDIVIWDETVAEMQKCAAGEIVIGKDKTKAVFRASLTELQDPHWGFDVNTLYGKSNFLGIVAVQVLHQHPDNEVTAIDSKRSSLTGFLGDPRGGDRPLLKGVTLANNPLDPVAMAKAVARVRRILDERSEALDLDRTTKFPIHLLILDELNQFSDIMKDYWRELVREDRLLPRDERENLPTSHQEAPWWQDIRTILRMGRDFNIHVVACAQDFRDDAFGGRGARNYLGFKGMAGYTKTQWDKFFATPWKRDHVRVGRWIFTNGHYEEWVQIVFADIRLSRAAYEYAAVGRGKAPDEETDPLDDADEGEACPVTELPVRKPIVGLYAAATYLGYSKPESFRRARRRYIEDTKADIPGMFEVGRRKQPAWYPEDLDAWKESRPRSRLTLVGSDSDE